ncbi:MAG: hypothetical protein H9882_02240 [Candidatus Fournierella pullistercoris]|uniref:Solute-binding protein family 5 domain-containing protein n=1 Tax=Candidatus Allofournierella pullistercoris TaxID=2838597 RepID=A0A948WQW0_9FIRM|nr:hypothetical protein [Candidatus Fournierella pullistercoris]
MSFSRFLALAMACAVLLSGCQAPASSSSSSSASAPVATPTPTASVQQLDTLRVGYTPSSGFNPYLSSSMLVWQNGGLLFEKLVEITPEMQLEYRLAEAIVPSGNLVVIQPRQGQSFADGTPITAQDIAASFWAAKSSQRYAARFQNLQNIEVNKEGQLVLTLSQPDSLFAYLCDIPVLKAADTASTQPTASGRYTYGTEDQLVVNPYAPFPQQGPQTIQLVEVSGYDEMVSGLSMGLVDMYAVSETAPTSSSVSSRATQYKTNNLVFLGVNGTGGEETSPLLRTETGRVLLSQMLDRRALVEESFYGRAYPATGLINDHYACAKDVHKILAEREIQPTDVAATLSQMGYVMDKETGYYLDAEQNRVTLRLLVYSGNTYMRYAASMIREQLADFGLYVQLEEESDFAVYHEKIAASNFHLYIGEVKLYNNMDMTPFFGGGDTSWGIATSQPLLDAYAQFRADASTAAALEQVFAQQMPFVPLLWRTGTVLHNRSLSGLSCSLSNVFYQLDGLQQSQ